MEIREKEGVEGLHARDCCSGLWLPSEQEDLCLDLDSFYCSVPGVSWSII